MASICWSRGTSSVSPFLQKNHFPAMSALMVSLLLQKGVREKPADRHQDIIVLPFLFTSHRFTPNNNFPTSNRCCFLQKGDLTPHWGRTHFLWERWWWKGLGFSPRCHPAKWDNKEEMAQDSSRKGCDTSAPCQTNPKAQFPDTASKICEILI